MKISMWQWEGNPVAWYTYYRNMVAWTGNTNHFRDNPTIEVEDRDTPIAEIVADMDTKNKYVLLTFVDEKTTREFWKALEEVERETESYPEILDAMLNATSVNWGKFSIDDTIREVLVPFVDKIVRLVLVSGCTYQEEYACRVFCNGAYALDIDRDNLTFIKSKTQ